MFQKLTVIALKGGQNVVRLIFLCCLLTPFSLVRKKKLYDVNEVRQRQKRKLLSVQNPLFRSALKPFLTSALSAQHSFSFWKKFWERPETNWGSSIRPISLSVLSIQTNFSKMLSARGPIPPDILAIFINAADFHLPDSRKIVCSAAHCLEGLLDRKSKGKIAMFFSIFMSRCYDTFITAETMYNFPFEQWTSY